MYPHTESTIEPNRSSLLRMFITFPEKDILIGFVTQEQGLKLYYSYGILNPFFSHHTHTLLLLSDVLKIHVMNSFLICKNVKKNKINNLEAG